MTTDPIRVEKSRLELTHLELFASRFDKFPGWPACHEQPPAPDFTLRAGTDIIGVEHTRLLVRSEVQRAREALLDRIVDHAREQVGRSNPPALLVTVHPKDVAGLTKRLVADIGDLLATSVLAALPDVGGRAEFPLFYVVDGHRCQTVARVSVRRPKPITRSNWNCVQVSVVEEDVQTLLQATLNDKDEKIEGYLGACGECWLLIVAEGNRPSGFAEPNAATRTREYEFRFARAFFMESPSGAVFELRKRGSSN